jgi:hypothetical protein
MPIIKLSVVGPGNVPEQTVELDETLSGQLVATVDAQSDLTLDEAFRRGIQHVVDSGPLGGGGQQ